MRPLAILNVVALAAGAFSAAVPEQVPLDGPVRTTASWSYKLCGEPSDPVQIHSIKVSPDPPQPGKNLTVTVKGTVSETLEEGAYAEVAVKLGLVKILNQEFDICEEARNANAEIQCPVEPGTYEIAHTVELPKEIPPAKFHVAVQGYNADDEDLLCLNLEVDFTKRFPHLW